MSTTTRRALVIFPLASLLNSFSMTALLLVFGIAGCSEIAADIGLVQGATLALFYAFSANARNLILADSGGAVATGLLRARLLLTLPLSGAAYVLSVGIGTVAAPLAIVLIVRRVSEWMGEIGLARHERAGNSAIAVQALTVEGLSFLLCLGLPLLFELDLAVSAIPWAFAPLWAVRGSRLSRHTGEGHLALETLLPHVGSTAIIGMSVYVFRISIALVAGKAVAGELFTAFAIGGLLPTVFGQALAPTLAHRFGTSALPGGLLPVSAAMLFVGAGVAVAAAWEPGWLTLLGRSPVFWLAVGLSIAGGAVMMIAAALRTRLIHRAGGQEVFGADLLANVLIATCVPFVFYILGPKALAGLYALSACLSLTFLSSAGSDQGHLVRHRGPVLQGIGVLLVLPVFFQISGGLFRDPAFVFDTGGAISRLPVPVSVLGLFGGIAMLGNYAAATRTLTVLFFTALLFVVTSITTSQGSLANEGAKLVLLAQFLLPMFGLVLGEMYGASSNERRFEWSALLVLLAIVPLHLLATWLQGYSLLSPSLYLFSIYQHLQYFPMVVASLGLMVVFAFWTQGGWPRVALWVLLPLLAIHVVASQSIIAMAALAFGLLYFVYASRLMGRSGVSAAILVGTALAAGSGYGLLSQPGSSTSILEPGRNAVENQLLGDKLKLDRNNVGIVPMPSGATQRIDHWRFYGRGVVESHGSFLLGHATPPDRAQHPSAHNYWLDALYNFGMLAVLPLLVLAIWTVHIAWWHRNVVLANPLLLGTAVAAGYLLLVENMLKVGMRQPYPGIITFFIWGLLIARLRGSDRNAARPVVQE